MVLIGPKLDNRKRKYFDFSLLIQHSGLTRASITLVTANDERDTIAYIKAL